MAVRIDTYKPKPMYGQWLMELAPSHTDPLNELGRLWANGQPATAFALAQGVKSAEAHRAGAGKWDRPKYHSVVIKLSNMLARRGRMGTLAMVNPRRKSRKNCGKNPSASKRRSAARRRHLTKYARLHRAIMNANWNSVGGNKLLGRRLAARDLLLKAGGSSRKMARITARKGKMSSKRRNPSAAWGKARKASRRKWIKDRFGYATHRSNPPRSARTGRFVRRGRK